MASSVLFGLARSEQGASGIVLTTPDAVFFTALRYRDGTLWAADLAHSLGNTIGLVAYFVTGPICGTW